MEKRFPNRLRELRLAAGLSQDELAARLGISQRAVSLHELGARDIAPDILGLYRRIYRVSTRDLFMAPEEEGVARVG